MSGSTLPRSRADAGLASPHADVLIPDQSLAAFLFDGVDDHLEKTALIDSSSGRDVTFGDLRSIVARVATALSARLEPGDIVALLAPNSADYVVGFLGALRAGIVVTPINTLATADDIAFQLTDAGARRILVDRSLAATARQAVESAGLPGDAVTILDEEIGRAAGLSPLASEPVVSPRTHLAVLPYSSGTTGRPKGVVLTHRNLVANVAQIEGLLGVGRGSVVLGVLPLSHIYGMTVSLHLALRRRVPIVLVPRFELDRVLGLVEAHRITHMFVAPPVVLMLSKSPEVDGYDLSSVELVLSGAAPLADELATSLARRLGCRVRQAYGMSEMSPVSHLAPIDAELPLDSVGWTVPNMRVRLVDLATGEDIPLPADGVSEPGELWCSGPNVMQGYLANEEATRGTLDADGFLHTGDVATIDARGVVTIVDRVKELIKYKGYQVAPAELEGLLLAHPDIADAAVVGMPQPDSGEEWPKAFVVPQEGARLSEESVMSYVANHVAPYKKIRLVDFVAEIPKSPSGKILRRLLRDGLASPRPRDVERTPPRSDQIDQGAFKAAFRDHPNGVAVITADAGDGPVAMTVTSVCSVSADPPLLAFSVSDLSSSAPSVRAARTVVVHLLDSVDQPLAVLCATSGADRFADERSWARLETGEPYYVGVHAALRCEVQSQVRAGTATIIVLRALSSAPARSDSAIHGSPLVYHARGWHGLSETSLLSA